MELAFSKSAVIIVTKNLAAGINASLDKGDGVKLSFLAVGVGTSN